MKKTVLLIGLLWGVFSGVYAKSNPYWERYFEAKQSDPPAEFVVAGLKQISLPKGAVAIDLGAGVGHETALLLQRGFYVIAVDGEPKALEWIQKHPHIRQQPSPDLKTVCALFENLDFRTLPSADLVVASFALPFVPRAAFDRVWQSVVRKVKPGGYFIGNFFDAKFAFARRFRPKMSFHTKRDTLDLFSEFELIRFQEIKRIDEKGKKQHYYAVVAKKRR